MRVVIVIKAFFFEKIYLHALREYLLKTIGIDRKIDEHQVFTYHG